MAKRKSSKKSSKKRAALVARVLSEDTLTFDQIPKEVPGKRVHKSTPYRWHYVGVHNVKLEAVKIGGSLVSSKQALTRFLTAINA